MANPDDRVKGPYHFSLRLFTEVRRSSYGPMRFQFWQDGKRAERWQKNKSSLLLLVRQMKTPVSSMKVAVTSQVPQATVELAGFDSVVWPDSLSEQLVERAGLQQTFSCLTASTAKALLCMADAEFRIQVMVEAVVVCPEPEHCHCFPCG